MPRLMGSSSRLSRFKHWRTGESCILLPSLSLSPVAVLSSSRRLPTHQSTCPYPPLTGLTVHLIIKFLFLTIRREERESELSNCESNPSLHPPSKEQSLAKAILPPARVDQRKPVDSLVLPPYHGRRWSVNTPYVQPY